MQSESFDAVAYEVEAHLRELRRIVGETVIFTDGQNAALINLRHNLYDIERKSSALRHSLLTGQDPSEVETKPVGETEPVTTL
ncbi:MAG: hypothetical protein H8F28_15480 [Fibrella sp.]|nr:hypothetical protein [Armatimonadota bacterium]